MIFTTLGIINGIKYAKNQNDPKHWDKKTEALQKLNEAKKKFNDVKNPPKK